MVFWTILKVGCFTCLPSLWTPLPTHAILVIQSRVWLIQLNAYDRIQAGYNRCFKGPSTCQIYCWKNVWIVDQTKYTRLRSYSILVQKWTTTFTSHSNPLCRVKPVNLIDEGNEEDYDKEKYRDMLLDAAETVLGCFGFSRSLYGD